MCSTTVNHSTDGSQGWFCWGMVTLTVCFNRMVVASESVESEKLEWQPRSTGRSLWLLHGVYPGWWVGVMVLSFTSLWLFVCISKLRLSLTKLPGQPQVVKGGLGVQLSGMASAWQARGPEFYSQFQKQNKKLKVSHQWQLAFDLQTKTLQNIASLASVASVFLQNLQVYSQLSLTSQVPA